MAGGNRLERVLAFDVGLKRTGVASGQTMTWSTQPAGQLRVNNGHFNWIEVDSLITEWQPSKIVIGNPKTDNPHLNKLINRLKSHIQLKHKLPIVEVDETLTTEAANSELRHAALSVVQRTKIRDQLAACLILESYFSSLNPH